MKIAPALTTVAALLFATAAQAATSFLDQSATAMATSHWQQAVQASQKALASSALTPAETLIALNNLCIAQAKRGLYQDALAACSKGIALNPGHFAAYINRGNLFAIMGDSRGALADFAKASALNPTHPTVKKAVAINFFLSPSQTGPFVAFNTPGAIGMKQAGAGQTATAE